MRSNSSLPKGAVEERAIFEGEYWLVAVPDLAEPYLDKVQASSNAPRNLMFPRSQFFKNYWDAYAYFTKEKAKAAKLASGGAGQ